MGNIEALFFDQDGVILDTEKDGHRVAFNRTFAEFDFPIRWDVETYHQLLQISGGKERMRHYLHTEGFGKEVKPERQDELIKALHKRKTEIFIQLIKSGRLPLRPGIKRLMSEAMAAGLKLAICTTSNERSAHAVACKVLKDISFDFVLAGDVVSRKKPDPEIYRLALERSGCRAENCVVIEDSHNGVMAAAAAGIASIATVNVYTEKEDLSAAEIVLSCLGDPDGERGQLIRSKRSFEFNGVLTVENIKTYFLTTRPRGDQSKS